MSAHLVSSRLLVRNAATALDENHSDTVALCAMAKFMATEACFNVSGSHLKIEIKIASYY